MQGGGVGIYSIAINTAVYVGTLKNRASNFCSLVDFIIDLLYLAELKTQLDMEAKLGKFI